MMNYILGGIILLLIFLALASIRRNRKNGSCCNGCSGCASAGRCSAYRSAETEIKQK